MNTWRAVLTVSNSDSDKTVLNGLLNFNIGKAGYYDSRPLSIRILRDEDDSCLGGLTGRTYWGWLYVDALWVREEQRGKGLGTELMRLAEKEAQSRGCHGAYLDTFDFQARSFYEKLGYSIFGELEDFPEEHTRYFMKKRFDILE